MRRTLALIAVLALAVSAAPAEGARNRAKSPRLKAFTSCAGLISYARRHVPPTPRFVAPRAPVPVSGGGEEDSGSAAPAPAPVAGPDSSTTNVQEAGVDEPDIVKTDGRRIFAVTDRTLRIVAPGGGVTASLALDGFGHQLLIRGDRVLVVASKGGSPTRP